MSFQSLPITAREIKATEAVLERLYNAAKLGLKGDNLALNAGLLPVEFRRLCQLDPIADLAVRKGYADAEGEMSQVVYAAARTGDTKAAMDMLKHRHDWTAAQKIEVSGSQAISITLALQAAEQRVINMGTIDEAPTSGNSTGLLTNDEGASNGYPNSNRRTVEDAVSVRR
jgi:hypothetical protein